MKAFLLAGLFAIALDANADCANGQPWYMTKAPTDPAKESSVFVLMSAPNATVVRVCYCVGPEDSHIWGRSGRDAAGLKVTQIYKGACADLGGSDVWLGNPNGVAVTGTYARDGAPTVAPVKP